MKGGGKIQRFFRWPNSNGRPAQVKSEKFSKAISILAVSSWPSLDGFRQKFAKLIVQYLKV
jgi:hypothetical protein